MSRYWTLVNQTLYVVEVVEEQGENVKVKPANGSLTPNNDFKEFTVKKEQLHTTAQALEELVHLRYFTETNVVNDLKWRFDNNLIYTNSGLFMLSVNPNKTISEAYAAAEIEAFKSNPNKLQTPHLYAIVQRAYQTMLKNEIDQSILILGVSGSGKTESVKIAINYLSAVSGGSGVLEKQINVAGVVLESFGNSRTIFNANSSRFEIKTYLLEKSRVAVVPPKERNFHIFYQLLRGLSAAQKTEWGLTNVASFAYLKNGLDATPQDAADFAAVEQQLTTLGFGKDKQAAVWKILAGILHLGNITFVEKEAEKATIVSSPSVAMAAKLLSVDVDALTKALTQLQMRDMTISLDKAKAELSRDSLAREVYERLFFWLVSQINNTTQVKGDPDDFGFIAILDISGYENVTTNRFEQLCINYTNDKLQELFNSVIHAEQEVYEEELDWEPIPFALDLQSICNLLDKKPEGIFCILDEVCYRQQATEEDFVNDVALVHKTKPQFSFSPSQPKQFKIKHSPGEVTYEAGDFLIKNRDILAKGLSDLMLAAKDEILRQLFVEPKESQQQKSSVGAFYLSQMEALLEAFRETDCSYLKCIKPNRDSSVSFDPKYVAEQIKWSAVVETITLCAKGFPSHQDYAAFVHRYSPLVAKLSGADDKAKAKQILTQSLKPAEFAAGKTKVLLAMGAQFKLDLMLTAIQKHGASGAAGQAQGQGLVDGIVQRTKTAWNWLFN